MQRLLKAVSLAVLLALSPAARAASFCKYSDTYLLKAANSCFANEAILSTAAIQCGSDFEEEVRRVTAQMEKALVGGRNGAVARVGAQSGFYGSAERNYDYTKQRLASLIREGKATHSRVKGYQDNLVFPEDTDLHPSWDFLASSPCYIDNLNLIQAVLTDVEEKILDLELVYDNAFGKERVSGTAKAKIRNDKEVGRKLSSPPAEQAGAAKVPAFAGKRPPRSNSTITGKIRNEKLESR